MRLSSILIIAFALALPISAQAGNNGGGGGTKSPSGTGASKTPAATTPSVRQSGGETDTVKPATSNGKKQRFDPYKNIKF
jgi:hypothetical protein